MVSKFILEAKDVKVIFSHLVYGWRDYATYSPLVVEAESFLIYFADMFLFNMDVSVANQVIQDVVDVSRSALHASENNLEQNVMRAEETEWMTPQADAVCVQGQNDLEAAKTLEEVLRTPRVSDNQENQERRSRSKSVARDQRQSSETNEQSQEVVVPAPKTAKRRIFVDPVTKISTNALNERMNHYSDLCTPFVPVIANKRRRQNVDELMSQPSRVSEIGGSRLGQIWTQTFSQKIADPEVPHEMELAAMSTAAQSAEALRDVSNRSDNNPNPLEFSSRLVIETPKLPGDVVDVPPLLPVENLCDLSKSLHGDITLATIPEQRETEIPNWDMTLTMQNAAKAFDLSLDMNCSLSVENKNENEILRRVSHS